MRCQFPPTPDSMGWHHDVFLDVELLPIPFQDVFWGVDAAAPHPTPALRLEPGLCLGDGDTGRCP